MTAATHRRPTAWVSLVTNEARLVLREPALVIWSVAAPLVADVVLASLPATQEPRPELGGLSWWQTYLEVLVVFVISILAMQILPSILAGYRADGVLRRLRTTPVTPFHLVAAVSAVCCAIALATVGLLIVVPLVLGSHVPGNGAAFVVVTALFLASALGVGSLVMALSPTNRFAMGLGTVATMVTWFSAGLWLPRVVMPDVLRAACDLTPGGAAAGGFAAALAGDWPSWPTIVTLLAWSAACGLAGARLFRWE